MTDTARLSRTVLPTAYDLVDRDRRRARPGSRAGSRSPSRSPNRSRRSSSTPRTSTSSWCGLTRDGDEIGARLSADPATERVTVRTDRPLDPGPARLELRFGAPVSRGLLGYYRSTYVDAAGAEQVLAATQFEAPHARRAFPCFDEPEFKATFAVTLVVAEGLLAISNGAEVGRESLGDGRVRVRFAPTIPMSTYLVAWVVGPARDHRAGRRGRGRGAGRARSRQGAPHPFRARRRVVRDQVLRRLLRHPLSRRRSATSSRSPTSRSARWRTSAA